MASDGYNQGDERFKSLKEKSAFQVKVNERLKEIAEELATLPKTPRSIDEWIESWHDPTRQNFSISDYKKHMKINREYQKLVNDAENNLREMKILAIEDIIDKINSTLNKSISD